MARYRATPKYAHRCIGGPFDGKTIWLTADGCAVPFSLKGYKGRYVKFGSNVARWEEML